MIFLFGGNDVQADESWTRVTVQSQLIDALLRHDADAVRRFIDEGAKLDGYYAKTVCSFLLCRDNSYRRATRDSFVAGYNDTLSVLFERRLLEPKFQFPVSSGERNMRNPSYTMTLLQVPFDASLCSTSFNALQQLIKHGARISETNNLGESTLHFMVRMFAPYYLGESYPEGSIFSHLREYFVERRNADARHAQWLPCKDKNSIQRNMIQLWKVGYQGDKEAFLKDVSRIKFDEYLYNAKWHGENIFEMAAAHGVSDEDQQFLVNLKTAVIAHRAKFRLYGQIMAIMQKKLPTGLGADVADYLGDSGMGVYATRIRTLERVDMSEKNRLEKSKQQFLPNQQTGLCSRSRRW